jgi:tetratricopeptide (TPR) repeat protein
MEKARKKNAPAKVKDEIKPAVKAPESAGGKFPFAKIFALIIAAGLLTSVYFTVDYYTGWGKPEKVLKRVMDEAEKGAIYKRYPEVVKKYQYIIDRWGKEEAFKEEIRQAKLGLAKAYKDGQQYIQAIEAYRDLIKDFENERGDMYAWLQLELGDCYNNIFNTKDAVVVYEKILKEYPNTDWAAEALFGVADAYRNNGDNIKAINYYTKIVEKYKKGFLSAEALTSMGKIFESEGKDKQALDVYTRVVKEYPDIVTEYAKMRHDVLTERIKN